MIKILKKSKIKLAIKSNLYKFSDRNIKNTIFKKLLKFLKTPIGTIIDYLKLFNELKEELY